MVEKSGTCFAHTAKAGRSPSHPTEQVSCGAPGGRKKPPPTHIIASFLGSTPPPPPSPPSLTLSPATAKKFSLLLFLGSNKYFWVGGMRQIGRCWLISAHISSWCQAWGVQFGRCSIFHLLQKKRSPLLYYYSLRLRQRKRCSKMLQNCFCCLLFFEDSTVLYMARP